MAVDTILRSINHVASADRAVGGPESRRISLHPQIGGRLPRDMDPVCLHYLFKFAPQVGVLRCSPVNLGDEEIATFGEQKPSCAVEYVFLSSLHFDLTGILERLQAVENSK